MDYGLLLAAYRASQPTRMPAQRLLYESLRAAILDGRIVQGTRLTASRALATELGMARNSVLYAYERLASEGYVTSGRHGTTVARLGLRPPTAAGPAAHLAPSGDSAAGPGLSRRVSGLGRDDSRTYELLPFKPGVPALEAFPLAHWRRCVERAWRALSPHHLGYGRAGGQPALRHAIAEYLRVARGVRCEAEQVFVTDGTQSALDLCARMLADAGDTAWVENPGYSGARGLPVSQPAAGTDPGRRRRHRAPAGALATGAAPPGLYHALAPVPARLGAEPGAQAGADRVGARRRRLDHRG